MIEQRVETWKDGFIWWAAGNGLYATGPTENMAVSNLNEQMRRAK